MSGCNQETITDAVLVHLVGIEYLVTEYCRRDVRIAAAQVTGIDYESDEFEGDVDDNESEDEDEDDGESEDEDEDDVE